MITTDQIQAAIDACPCDGRCRECVQRFWEAEALKADERAIWRGLEFAASGASL